MKCTEETCNEEATEVRHRGEEKIHYCLDHARWWDKIMENCY